MNFVAMVKTILGHHQHQGKFVEPHGTHDNFQFNVHDFMSSTMNKSSLSVLIPFHDLMSSTMNKNTCPGKHVFDNI
jgi:hypothetical protein